MKLAVMEVICFSRTRPLSVCEAIHNFAPRAPNNSVVTDLEVTMALLACSAVTRRAIVMFPRHYLEYLRVRLAECYFFLQATFRKHFKQAKAVP